MPALSRWLTFVPLVSALGFALADPRKQLTPDQQALKAAFDYRLKENREAVRDKCGPQVEVTIDFENFDKAKWLDDRSEADHLKPGDPNYTSRREDWGRNFWGLWDNCGHALEALATQCKSAKWKDAAAKVVRVACLFTGYKPRNVAEKEGQTVHTRRNVTLVNGVLTVPNHPRLADVDGVAKSLIQDPAGAVRPAPSAINLGNGASCDRWSQCESMVCQSGTCRMCKADSMCQPGSTCIDGTCWSRAALERTTEAPSPSSPSSPRTKPKGAERGRMCGKAADCQSGVCKMENATRGRCQ